MCTDKDTEPESSDGSLREVSIEFDSIVTVDDSNGKGSGKLGWSCLRYFIIPGFFVCLGAGGISLYLTVFMTQEQLLASFADNGTFLDQKPVFGQRQDESDILKASTKGIGCPANWTYHNGKCYIYSTVPVHSSDGKEYCASVGAVHLNNESMTSIKVQKLMKNQIDVIIGCCQFGKEMSGNNREFTEKILETGVDVSTSHYLTTMSSLKNLSDDKSKFETGHVTQSALHPAFFFANPAAADNNTFHLRTTTENADTNIVSFSKLLPTPTSVYGFWLGAGHKHHHDTEAETVNENAAQGHRHSNAHADVDLEDEGAIKELSEPQINQDENNQSKTVIDEAFQSHCRQFEYDLYSWQNVDCERSFIQICERNP